LLFIYDRWPEWSRMGGQFAMESVAGME